MQPRLATVLWSTIEYHTKTVTVRYAEQTGQQRPPAIITLNTFTGQHRHIPFQQEISQSWFFLGTHQIATSWDLGW